MKTRLILSGAAAVLCASALSSAQIAPQGGVQQRPPQPKAQQPRATPNAGPLMTLAGCLYREQSIPGRSPNVAEKAGVGEDFILADATPSRTADRPIADAGQPDAQRAGQSEQARPAPPDPQQPGTAAGLATGRMYKVTKIDDHRLKELVGKRVEITGTIKPDDDVRPGEETRFENLPNIEGTSIREVAGAACPARPAVSSPAPPASNPNR